MARWRSVFVFGGTDFCRGVVHALIFRIGITGAAACRLPLHGALDFAGGTVVHINAAIAGLVGADELANASLLEKKHLKPHNLPMVFFTGTAILYIGWFGFNAGSAVAQTR